MKSIVFVGIIAALAVAMTATVGFGMSIAGAQTMEDNATMAGNMTGGNMTMGAGNMTEGTGNISGVGGVL